MDLQNTVKVTGHVVMIFHDIERNTGRVREYDNLITDAGAQAIARRLINEGTKTNEGLISYCALGTGAGTPAKTDTAMFTELTRKAVTLGERTLAVSTISTFFTTSEGNGTLTEIGLFGEDASATPASGTLFEHCSITETKTNAETLTIQVVITITN